MTTGGTSAGSAPRGDLRPGPGSSAGRGSPRLRGEEPSHDHAPAADSETSDADRGEAELREAASRLEGVFIQKLFEAMRSTVPDGGYLDAGRGQEIFRGLMDRHLARSAAERLDRGLGEALYRQLRRAASPGSSHEAGGQG